MFTLLFALGTIPFWIMVGVLCVIEIALVENEKGVFAAAVVAAFFTCLAVFGDFNVLRFAKDHPLFDVFAFLGYFVAGAVWSVAKFSLYGNNWRRTYKELRKDFYEHNGVTGNPETVPVELREKWEEDYGRKNHLKSSPDPRKMVTHISRWMAYWPFSLVWFVIHDPIRRAFREIRIRLQRVYERVAAHYTRGIEDDIKKEPPAPPAAPTDDTNGSSATAGRTGRPMPGRGREYP